MVIFGIIHHSSSSSPLSVLQIRVVNFCHSLANLIAVILGCEPQCNHLWYNLFAADQLTGTYMPGFMIRKP